MPHSNMKSNVAWACFLNYIPAQACYMMILNECGFKNSTAKTVFKEILVQQD